MDAQRGPRDHFLSKRVLIVGIGNDMRGDDAAGLLVVRRLREMGVDADLRECGGDGAEMMDLWRDAEETILIDAVRSGAPPGTIHCFDACCEPIPAAFRNSPSTHLFSVAEAIELARSLLRLPPKMTVYGIEGGEFSLGTSPSPNVVGAIERVVADVAGYLGSRG
ncbi:MAG: peptidase M52 [Fimbriimonadales bacterium]